MATLFAWCIPAFVTGSPVDHTWVTTYDNRANPYPDVRAVQSAKEDYWYCWGGFHPAGGTPQQADGYLGSQAGDLTLARCLVQSNADSQAVFAARGTIFTYGIDGVCHQLANQVLYATGIGGAAPLTVAGANGYMLSAFLYGTYGLQHQAWANKLAACGAAVVAGRGSNLGARTMGQNPPPSPPALPDDFDRAMSRVLAGQPEKVAQVARLRAQFQQSASADAHAMVAMTHELLNQRNQRFLDSVAASIGAEEYEALFGVKPGEQVNLVVPQPTQARAPSPGPATRRR